MKSWCHCQGWQFYRNEERKLNLDDEEDTTDIWTAILDLKTIFSLVLLCIFEFDSLLRGIWKQILQCHRCIESHMMQGKLANLEADVEPLTLMQLSRFLIRCCISHYGNQQMYCIE